MSETITKLPLSIFERYMLRDHTVEYPMMQFLHAEFQGNLDPDRLSEALENAIARHPLLTARVEGWGKQAMWVFAPETPPPVRFASVARFEEIPRTFTGLIIPALGRHLVAWHHPTETGCKLILAVSHFVCDGIGGYQFFADWLHAYHQLYEGIRIEEPNTNDLIAQLPRRDLPGWRESGQVVTRWQAIRSFLRETKNWYFRSPQVIAAPIRRDPVMPACCDIYMRTLSATETRGLRNVALAQQVTLNDLLLREVFLHLMRWNARHGKQRERDWLRILMPTSLRGSGDKSLSAVNRLGFTFLTHRVAECQNPEQLLESLKSETASIRRWNLGQMFLDGLAIAEKIPGVMPLFTRRNSCLSTTVFSNIGDVTRRFTITLPRDGKSMRVGQARIIRIAGTPPLRPGTRAVIFASMFAGELTLSGLTDGRFFDAELKKEWWDTLFEQLLAVSAESQRLKPEQTIEASS